MIWIGRGWYWNRSSDAGGGGVSRSHSERAAAPALFLSNPTVHLRSAATPGSVGRLVRQWIEWPLRHATTGQPLIQEPRAGIARGFLLLCTGVVVARRSAA